MFPPAADGGIKHQILNQTPPKPGVIWLHCCCSIRFFQKLDNWRKKSHILVEKGAFWKMFSPAHMIFGYFWRKLRIFSYEFGIDPKFSKSFIKYNILAGTTVYVLRKRKIIFCFKKNNFTFYPFTFTFTFSWFSRFYLTFAILRKYNKKRSIFYVYISIIRFALYVLYIKSKIKYYFTVFYVKQLYVFYV